MPTISQVVAVARTATAHNSGATVWEHWHDGVGVVLRMSSWPRAKEAERALIAQGWGVEFLADDGKGHTLIRVSS